MSDSNEDKKTEKPSWDEFCLSWRQAHYEIDHKKDTEVVFIKKDEPSPRFYRHAFKPEEITWDLTKYTCTLPKSPDGNFHSRGFATRMGDPWLKWDELPWLDIQTITIHFSKSHE
jgi:hypothetical protein